MSTYIKLYRALLDHDLLANDNTAFVVFTKVLLKADWKTGTYRTGRNKLGLLTNLKATTSWAALQRLANDGALTLTTTGRFTDIHISNWWKYQGESEKANDSSVTRSQHSNDTKQEQKNKEIILTSEQRLLLDTANEMFNREFEKLPYSAKPALEKYTIEQIKTAWGNLIEDEWHQGKTQKQTLNYFLQPGTIKRFLPPPGGTAPKPSIQIGGTAKKTESLGDKASMTRRELQELEQG